MNDVICPSTCTSTMWEPQVWELNISRVKALLRVHSQAHRCEESYSVLARLPLIHQAHQPFIAIPMNQ